MTTTQDHIQISGIQDGIVLLKDGGAALIIQTNAVNFGLLSGEEQMAIIGSFAQMLNSLSFSIQIVIMSKRLDISSYLKLLDIAVQRQTNLMLAQMMMRYRQFIQSLIKDNEVLDKRFYIVIPLSYLELGISVGKDPERLKKAKTALEPRRDQISRQLNRVGLDAKQLKDKELLELFYDIYAKPREDAVILPSKINLQTPTSIPKDLQSAKPQEVVSSSEQNVVSPPPARPKSHPFVVEELQDSP